MESGELGVERWPWEGYTCVVVMPLISTSGDMSRLTSHNPTDLEERATTGLEGKRVLNSRRSSSSERSVPALLDGERWLAATEAVDRVSRPSPDPTSFSVRLLAKTC